MCPVVVVVVVAAGDGAGPADGQTIRVIIEATGFSCSTLL